MLNSLASASYTNARVVVLAACSVLTTYLLASNMEAPAKGSPVALPVACSPGKPTVSPGGKVQLLAWAGPFTQLQYTWTVEAGELLNQGADLQWSFVDVQPGIYEATVTVSNGVDVAPKCTLHVRVENHERDINPNRDTGRAFLRKGEDEKAGYGLYSYLLLGSRPTDLTRQRFVSAIDAYLQMIEEIGKLDEYIARDKLNVTYLPVTDSPPIPFLAPNGFWSTTTSPGREPYLTCCPGPTGTARTLFLS